MRTSANLSVKNFARTIIADFAVVRIHRKRCRFFFDNRVLYSRRAYTIIMSDVHHESFSATRNYLKTRPNIVMMVQAQWTAECNGVCCVLLYVLDEHDDDEFRIWLWKKLGCVVQPYGFKCIREYCRRSSPGLRPEGKCVAQWFEKKRNRKINYNINRVHTAVYSYGIL